MEFAVYQLQDVANTWYDSWEQGRQVVAPPIKWGEFNERFLPKSVRQARAREFETLKQCPNMTIAEYDIRFIQLSCYAPHLILTEEHKIE